MRLRSPSELSWAFLPSRSLEPDPGPSPGALTTLQFVFHPSAYLFSPPRSKNRTQYQAQCLLLGVSGIMSESTGLHVYLQSRVGSLGRKIHSLWLHIVLKAQRYVSWVSLAGTLTCLCSFRPSQEWWYSNSELTKNQWTRTALNLPTWDNIISGDANIQDIQKNKFLMKVNILDNPF